MSQKKSADETEYPSANLVVPAKAGMRSTMRASALALLIATFGTGSVDAGTPATRNWNFDVLLDGKPIGYHNFHLVDGADARELTSEARFTVRILFVTAYRYVHDATEVWRNGCLERIASKTDDNGKKFKTDGALAPEGFVVSDGKTTAQFPQCSMTFAYWNPQILTGTQLVNIQTGKYDRVTISRLADESFVARGVSQAAQHYRIIGDKLNIELWYTKDQDWIGLQSTTEDGRKLRYQIK